MGPKTVTPDEIKALRELLEKSSDANKSLLIFFLSVLIYIALTVFSTTDQQIFESNSRIILPLLSVELPLLSYYIVIPFIIIILHYYIIIHIRHHMGLLKQWRDIESTRNELLNPFILNFLIIEAVGRKAEFKKGFYYILCHFIYFLIPLLMLFMIQGKFSSYHSYSITTLHFLACVGEYFLIRKAAPEIFSIYVPGRRSVWVKLIMKSEKIVLGLGIFHFVVLFNLLLLNALPRYFISLFKTLGILPYLVLSDANLVREAPNEKWIEYYVSYSLTSGKENLTDLQEDFFRTFSKGHSLRGRHFSYADFSGAILTNSDFRNCVLTGCTFSNASLEGADFSDASMQKANFENAKLAEATFDHADLTMAFMNGATARRTSFRYARLVASNMRSVVISDSSDFTYAVLDGTEFEESKIEHALFALSHMKGCNLTNCQLVQTDFRKTDLRGSILRQAHFTKSDLRGGNFRGTDISYATFDSSALAKADFEGAIAFSLRFDTLSRRGLILHHVLVDKQVWINGKLSGVLEDTDPGYLKLRDSIAEGGGYFVARRMAHLNTTNDQVLEKLEARIQLGPGFKVHSVEEWLKENLYDH